MATQAQIEAMLHKLEQFHPTAFFKRMDETQAGIGAVLRLLDESNETVTAGKISDILNISTARVAVLLKKMVARGLITKEHDVSDARVTIVKLTPLGKQLIFKMRQDLYQQMGRIIDQIGEKRLLEFIDTFHEIRKIVSPPEIG